MKASKATKSSKAIFAAGCFWGVEETFLSQEGVLSTQVGYVGGDTKDPDYKAVCTGTTNHAEAVEVTFDPSIISYAALLDLFWSLHDPTTLNRQGPDVGTQYRSAIFCLDDEQYREATAAKQALDQSKTLHAPIATQISLICLDSTKGTLTPFYPAEEYHQQYIRKRRALGFNPSCH